MPRTSEITTDVAIVGAGPAGLMAADRLAGKGLAITVFDAMATPGRKFLMAGRGGLNLTHSESLPRFIARYGDRSDRMRPLLEYFPPDELRRWADALGAETFVGSSGRAFPKAMKASGLLRRWLKRLADAGVEFRLRHRWIGFDGDRLVFSRGDETPLKVSARATVLALGGASWPKLGSDAAWVPLLAARGVEVRPLQPANCGFDIAWSPHFRAFAAGVPVKNVALTLNGQAAHGELMITEHGIEGGVVYAISGRLRDAISEASEPVTVTLDLKPQMEMAELSRRVSDRRSSRTLSSWLTGDLRLPSLAYSLLRETTDPLPDEPSELARLIKHVPLRILRPRPMVEAISSAGGIDFDALDEHLMLRACPGIFAAGEMLDWEAPTGGYLLQGCMTSAIVAADGVLARFGLCSPELPEGGRGKTG